MTFAPNSTDFDTTVREDLVIRSSRVLLPHGRHNLKANRTLLIEPKRWLDSLDIVILEVHRELDKIHGEIAQIKESQFYKPEFVGSVAKAESRRSKLTRDALVAEVRRGEVACVVAMAATDDSAITLLASALREHKRRKDGVGDEIDEALWAMLQGEWGFE